MKIEKLTDNKIRVIINSQDLGTTKINTNIILSKSLEGQDFFSNVLEKAKEKFGFDSSNCKLLIETFSVSDDILIFTITKYSLENTTVSINSSKEKLIVKKKSYKYKNNSIYYSFINIDEFYDFCYYLNNFNYLKKQNTYIDFSLYLYNNTYYLFIKNLNNNYETIKFLYNILSEFNISTCSSNFENKLMEHGELIIENVSIKLLLNALNKKI